VEDPSTGLVSSQASRLDTTASDFKQYLALHPDAKLILGGHADERASEAYNRALSQRRADLVKNYLVEQGVPAGMIETRAYGKDRNLTNQQVETLVAKDPKATPEEREQVRHNVSLYRMANNRRVDIRLSTGFKSKRFYPYNAVDLNVLLQLKEPAASRIASLR